MPSKMGEDKLRDSDRSAPVEMSDSNSIKDVLRDASGQETAKKGQDPLFEPKLQRRFQRLEQMLKDTDSHCGIELMGVAHIGEAGQGIIGRAREAQIVTLELTRNIVHAGLADEQAGILGKNTFWNSLINGIRDRGEGQLVRGIEVNQTVRVAWKRLSLHYGYTTLAPSLFTVELKDTNSEELRQLQDKKFIDEQDILKLQQYNWVIVESARIMLAIAEARNRVLDQVVSRDLGQQEIDEFWKSWPLQISKEFYLAADSRGPLEEPYLTTFIKEPDISLLRAKELVSEVLEGLPGLTESERDAISLCPLQAILLSHSELKDAEEIFNCAWQYAREHKDEKHMHMHLLHLGGAFHSKAIRQTLISNITDPSRMEVSLVKDPRLQDSLFDASFGGFFCDHISLRELLSEIRVKGFEVYADPERIASAVRRAIAENREDFYRRLFIMRMEKKYNTFEEYQDLNKEEVYLGSLRMDVLHAKYLRLLPELRGREER